jgi:hypothetical protein
VLVLEYEAGWQGAGALLPFVAAYVDGVDLPAARSPSTGSPIY